MNQGPKAKIEIEIDDAEARRQMEALRAEYGMDGRGGGGGGPGRPRVPGGGPRVQPPGGGGAASGAMGALGAAKIAAALTAALAPLFKSTLSDVAAITKAGWDRIDAATNRASRAATDDGKSADAARADIEARKRVEQFGRDTYGKASGAQLDAVYGMEIQKLYMQERGAAAARNRVYEWRTALGGTYR